MSLRVVSITAKRAHAWVAEHHRHLPKIQGGLFAAGAADGDRLCGVAIAAHPPRVWMPECGWGGPGS